MFQAVEFRIRGRLVHLADAAVDLVKLGPQPRGPLAALERLKQDAGTEALKLQLQGLSYQEIAERLGRKTTDVTNFIHRAKERLKKEFERLIAEYSTREDVAEEIAALRRFL